MTANSTGRTLASTHAISTAWPTWPRWGGGSSGVSAEILRYRPQVIIVRTCQALRAAGADWPLITQILRDLVR